MSIEQASTFFVGSLLTMLGFIVIIAGIVAINNLLHRYWKPVKIFTPDSWKGFFPPYQSQFIQSEPDKSNNPKEIK